ncbi:MAG: type IV pilus assembly protein PilN [Zhongshania sp.]|jgi:type IV pilus assembly protein PilN
MAAINLLPWREDRRQLIKTQFFLVLGGSALLAVLLVVLAMSIVNSAITHQNSRNVYLTAQINKINKEVAEIKNLEARRQQLLDRMTIIQDLQGTRPLIVRVFDEMVRTLPDGLFYTSVSRQDGLIDVQGIAESNNRVSSLMRSLDASPWFADPNLTAVSAASAYGEQASSFKLSYKISAPAPDDEK